jgi:hypothetical protein
MRKSVALPAIAALSLAGPALADGFSYNYIEGALGSSELEIEGLSGNADGDGGYLGGSGELSKHVFGFINGTSMEYEDVLRITSSSLGVGFNWALSPNLDLVSTLSAERVELEVDGDSESEDGVGVGVGLRGRIGERFEWTVGGKYRDIDVTKATTFSLGGRYYISPRFAVGAEVVANEYEDDETTDTIDEAIVMVNFRYDFGNRH